MAEKLNQSETGFGIRTKFNTNADLIEDKQNALVSGETIKTINGLPLLGSGNITISGSEGGGISDGNKGDVIVTNGGTSWSVPELVHKATPNDIQQALEASTIFFDEETFEGKNYPIPTVGEPEIGTAENPIKSKGGIGIVIDEIISGNANAVTSNAVFNAISNANTAISGGYNGTLQDLYNLITSGLPTPEPPTNFIVDNVNNTGDWTFNVDKTNITDYEYQINGGTVIEATVKPFIVGNIDAAIGAVRIRIKAVAGVSNASAWLSNPTAYTSSAAGANLMTGASLLDILAIKNDSLVDVNNGVYTMNISSSYSYTGQAIQNLVAGNLIAIKFTEDTKNVTMGVVEHMGDYSDTPKIGVYINELQVAFVQIRDMPDVQLTVQPVVGQWIILKRLTLQDGSGYSDWQIGYSDVNGVISSFQNFSIQYVDNVDNAPAFKLANIQGIEINSPQFKAS